MASKRKQPEPSPEAPSVDAATGREMIAERITTAQFLLKGIPTEHDVSTWNVITRDTLEKAFGLNSRKVDSVMTIGTMMAIHSAMTDSDFDERRISTLERKIAVLKGFYEVLDNEVRMQSKGAATVQSDSDGRKIFLVHGHDSVLHEVARFLEKLRQEVVILGEEPNLGQPVIEKFEGNSDVRFAVVLLTPDDVGGKSGSAMEQLKPRARQNVILELGYFIGKLGRSHVCALYKGDVEIPSDYSGVLYIPLDNEGVWRLRLAKELQNAEFAVNMNLV